jgi:hypothetical protein
VSYRSMNLKDEAYLVEVVKDQVCYVASDVPAEMAKCFPKQKSTISLEVLLPDGVENVRGIVQDPRDPRCKSTTCLEMQLAYHLNCGLEQRLCDTCLHVAALIRKSTGYDARGTYDMSGLVYFSTFHVTMYQSCEASSSTNDVNYTVLLENVPAYSR